MIALLFPGQGSQEARMGVELFAAEPSFAGWIELASREAGCDLEHILRRGPESALSQTLVLQPLLVCVSLGYRQCLTRAGVRPSLVAGHSLGELSALAAAGVLQPEEAVHLAACRGRSMQAAASVAEGGMVAVTTDDAAAVRALVDSLPDARLELANENSPTQLVFSGSSADLEQAVESIALARLGTCRRLAVSGAWHSPQMESARAEFAVAAEALPFRPPELPWISNVTGCVEQDPGRIRELLVQGLTRTVQWRAVMDVIREAKVGTLLEVGPGRVLCGLARANGFGVETSCFPVNNLRGVQTAARNAERAGA